MKGKHLGENRQSRFERICVRTLGAPIEVELNSSAQKWTLACVG
jgi:hypothetical protein